MILLLATIIFLVLPAIVKGLLRKWAAESSIRRQPEGYSWALDELHRLNEDDAA